MEYKSRLFKFQPGCLPCLQLQGYLIEFNEVVHVQHSWQIVARSIWWALLKFCSIGAGFLSPAVGQAATQLLCKRVSQNTVSPGKTNLTLCSWNKLFRQFGRPVQTSPQIHGFKVLYFEKCSIKAWNIFNIKKAPSEWWNGAWAWGKFSCLSSLGLSSVT